MSNIRNILITLFVLGLAACCGGCSYVSVEAGEEGVMTYKPWIFGHGGVDSNPIKTGAIWTVWSTSVNRYNIKPKKITETFIDLTAKDNVAIDFNAYLTVQVVAGKSPVLHEFSGKRWYENKVKDVFRTIVRNEGRTRSSIELRTNPKIINASQKAILKNIRKHLKDTGLPVIATKVVIGKVIPPKEVLVEAERTAAQKQRVKTQNARVLAERSRKAAEVAKALADKAYADKFKMTTAQFLKNKELDIIKDKKNVTVIMGNAAPYFNIMRKLK